MAKKANQKEDTTRYNVFCQQCGSVWQPALKSPLWWQAKQLADTGRLDALCVSPQKCGCVEGRPQRNPKAPFRVFGYDGFCEDFDILCTTFVQAAKRFLNSSRGGDIVHISGVSKRVQDRLEYGI
jgi:hypothetical protein